MAAPPGPKHDTPSGHWSSNNRAACANERGGLLRNVGIAKLASNRSVNLSITDISWVGGFEVRYFDRLVLGYGGGPVHLLRQHRRDIVVAP